MEKQLFGFIAADEEDRIDNIRVYSSLQELYEETEDTESGTVYIFDLSEVGIVDVTPRFVPDRPETRRTKKG